MNHEFHEHNHGERSERDRGPRGSGRGRGRGPGGHRGGPFGRGDEMFRGGFPLADVSVFAAATCERPSWSCSMSHPATATKSSKS